MGFNIENSTRLTNREQNYSTETIKIIFINSQNRNTFVQTGLPVDSMHFPVEPAIQNIKPVQCHTCLRYNHMPKYCYFILRENDLLFFL